MITDSRFVRNILVGCRSATVGDAHRHGRPPLSVLRVEGGTWNGGGEDSHCWDNLLI